MGSFTLVSSEQLFRIGHSVEVARCDALPLSCATLVQNAWVAMNLLVFHLFNPGPQFLILRLKILLFDSDGLDQLDRPHHVIV